MAPSLQPQSTKGKIYSTLHIVLLFERKYEWYVWNIVAPNLLLVLLNLTCYTMPVRQRLSQFDIHQVIAVVVSQTDGISERMGTAVALVLATLFLKFTAIEYSQKLPYNTLLDFFLVSCLAVQVRLRQSPCQRPVASDPSCHKTQVTIGLSNSLIFQLTRHARLKEFAPLVNGASCLIMFVSAVVLTLWLKRKIYINKKQHAKVFAAIDT